MNNVILMSEYNHGLIGMATNYISAINFLIEYDWLNENTEIFYFNGNDGPSSVKDTFGENWRQAIKNLSLGEFNDTVEGLFLLDSQNIYTNNK